MRIIYTDHARERMAEREITEGDVTSALLSSGVSYEEKKAKIYFGPGENGRPLKVWTKLPGFSGEGTTIIITTAWRDEE